MIQSVLQLLKGLFFWKREFSSWKSMILSLLDLQKLHFHCIIAEYIKVMPAVLFRFPAISIYAY